MISVISASASSCSSGPSPSTSLSSEPTTFSLSDLVMVTLLSRKYSSVSSTIFSRTPSRLVTSSWSAYFSSRRVWIWTLAAVKAGLWDSPTAEVAAVAAAARRVTWGAAWAAAAAAWAARPVATPEGGPLLPAAGGAVGAPWLALTLSSRPIFSWRRDAPRTSSLLTWPRDPRLRRRRVSEQRPDP